MPESGMYRRGVLHQHTRDYGNTFRSCEQHCSQPITLRGGLREDDRVQNSAERQPRRPIAAFRLVSRKAARVLAYPRESGVLRHPGRADKKNVTRCDFGIGVAALPAVSGIAADIEEMQ